MNKEKYIGVTIGPIYKTLALAKKTRELWGASYIFSYLMKNLIKALIDKRIEKESIILPYAGDIDEKEYHYGAGIYPDCLIFRVQEGDFEKVKQVVTDVLSQLGKDIADHIVDDKEGVKKYISDYFQVYFLEREIDEGESPALQLSPFLSTMELQQKIIPEEKEFLGKFLDRINGSFLFEDGFKDPETGKYLKKRFKSLVEISAQELRKYDKEGFDKIIEKHFKNRDKGDEEEDKLIEALKNNEKINKHFKTYHKYIAIVQADGDNIGNTLEKIGGDIYKLKEFSKELRNFAKKAAEIIANYGGTPVYVGGDDLLFFAPVANQDAEIGVEKVPSIFALIDTLDSKFKKSFDNVSLSFGLSISYYKFPLNEALKEARNLLENQAKKFKTENKAGEKIEKNALSFRVLKHSGTAFGAVFNKNSGTYSRFMELLKAYGGEEQHLNSLVHTLNRHMPVFKVIGKDEERVINFLHNSFDEEFHEKFKGFLEKAAGLIVTVFKESEAITEKKDEPIESKEKKIFKIIYAVLRTLHFLKRKDNERI